MSPGCQPWLSLLKLAGAWVPGPGAHWKGVQVQPCRTAPLVDAREGQGTPQTAAAWGAPVAGKVVVGSVRAPGETPSCRPSHPLHPPLHRGKHGADPGERLCTPFAPRGRPLLLGEQSRGVAMTRPRGRVEQAGCQASLAPHPGARRLPKVATPPQGESPLP